MNRRLRAPLVIFAVSLAGCAAAGPGASWLAWLVVGLAVVLGMAGDRAAAATGAKDAGAGTSPTDVVPVAATLEVTLEERLPLVQASVQSLDAELRGVLRRYQPHQLRSRRGPRWTGEDANRARIFLKLGEEGHGPVDLQAIERELGPTWDWEGNR